jgi:hypothetical protein
MQYHEVMQQLGAHAIGEGLGQQEVGTTIDSAYSKVKSENKLGTFVARSKQDDKPEVFLSSADPIDTRYPVYFPPEEKTELLEYPAPRVDWQQRDLVDYLKALRFEDDEYFSVVKDAAPKADGSGGYRPGGAGKWQPVSVLREWFVQHQGSTAEQLIKPSAEAGAWCRLNPVDGTGVKDANVTAYRHALVECDSMPVEDQWKILQKAKVPCAAVVHSGDKSLHAVVRVEAVDKEQFSARVAKLYEVLSSYGLEVDTQNKNPSRLSRLPGVSRSGSPQYLIATDQGEKTWLAWEEWLLHSQGVPEPYNFGELMRLGIPDPTEEVIEGILRRGHKMQISGASKMGKTWLMLQLAAAVTAGGQWVGQRCHKGKVLYVNMEIHPDSFPLRVTQVGEHVPGFDPDMLTVIEMHGHAVPMELLKKRILGHTAQKDYSMIIIDPIYKALGGADENNAGDITEVCNELDMIAKVSGASVAWAGHFAKGNAGDRSSIDRTSGSGVWGRDPDTHGTLVELTGQYDESEGMGYRLEWNLREFPKAPQTTVRFKWPIFTFDDRLMDVKSDGGSGAPLKCPAAGKDFYDSVFAYETSKGLEKRQIPLSELITFFQVGERTVRGRIKETEGLSVDKATVYREGKNLSEPPF